MPQDLTSVLRRRGRQYAGELLKLLGVSRPTLMRAVQAAGADVVVRGRARRTAYAARRSLRGSLSALPLYRVDEAGQVQEIARLDLTYPDGCALEFLQDFGWPLDAGAMQEGWFEGLPYPLQDMRPQGFLGRHFARRHAALLQVPENPALWTDDDALHALSLLGADTPGNLILGEAACRTWLDQVQGYRQAPDTPGWAEDELAEAYPRLAEQALAQGVPGSSAGGEFPKFTALRREATQHVLVKFSGSDGAPGTQRWADLLVCEHLAGQVLQDQLGIPAAASRLLTAAGRTFLEVARFDRHGLFGRSGLVSWAALDGTFFGTAGRPWGEAGRRLAERGWLSAQEAEQLARLWHFGLLIGNSDMHDGNLSFQLNFGPSGSDGAGRSQLSSQRSVARQGPSLRLAPVYDMLPMRYAPVQGMELLTRDITPRLPLPSEQAAWQVAARAALVFWQTAAEDPRISAGFRQVCGGNAGVLAGVMAL
jgi:hypothetical protein